MALLNEMDSLFEFLTVSFPEINVERQMFPLEYIPPLFVIRATKSNSSVDTGASTLFTRRWEIIYQGDSPQDCLLKAEMIESLLANKRFVIPLKDDYPRVLRVNTPGFSEPFLNESKINTIIGVFTTNIREAIATETPDKINEVKVNPN